MLGEELCRQRDGLLRGNHAVGPNLQGQLVVVDALAHTGVFHVKVHLIHRGVNRVNRNNANDIGSHVLLVAVRGHIPAAFVQRNFHVELCALVEGGDVQFWVQNLHFAVTLNGICCYVAGAFRTDFNGLGTVAVQLCGKVLDIQNHFSDVLFYTGNGGKLVYHTVYFNRGRGHARQRGKQHAPQAVAQGCTKAALQRRHHELAVIAVIRYVCYFNFGLFYLDH